jgi:hypothetical protein
MGVAGPGRRWIISELSTLHAPDSVGSRPKPDFTIIEQKISESQKNLLASV